MSSRSAGSEVEVGAEVGVGVGTKSPAPIMPVGSPQRHFGRWLLAVTFVGLIVRVLFVLMVTGEQPIAQSDALYYSAQAVTVGDGRGFIEPFDPSITTPRADHPPLTAIVAAPATWLPEGTWLGQPSFQVAQKLTMALIGALTVFFVGLTARRASGGSRFRLGISAEAIGLLAALIAALNPTMWVNDGLVMSESVGALTVAVLLYVAIGAWEKPTAWGWVRVGAACGFAALARAEALALVGVLGVPMALAATSKTGRWAWSVSGVREGVREWWRLGSWRKAALAIVLMGVATAGVIAPWVGPNLVRFDNPVTMSTNDGLTVLGAYCESMFQGDATGWWDLSCIGQVDTDGDGKNDWEEYFDGTLSAPGTPDASVYSEAYRKAGIEFAGENLDRLPGVATVRVLRTWGLWRPGQMAEFGRGEYRPRAVSLAGWGLHILGLPFALIGLVALWRGRRPVWVFASQAVAVTLISAAFYGQWRFRVGWDVAACVLVAVGLAAVPRVIERSRRMESLPLQIPARTFEGLYGLRAVAMFAVMGLHVASSSGADTRFDIGRFFARGDAGLSLFFVISGFLVVRPFFAAQYGSGTPSIRSYYRHRAGRILPGYWAALLILFAVSALVTLTADGRYVDGRPSARGLLSLATFAHTLRGSSAIEGISQAWSLGVEVCFYAFVPLLALVLRRRSGAAAVSPSRRGWLRNQQVLLSLGLIALGTLWRFGVALAKPSWGGSAIYWLPTYLDIFAGGMLMAAVSVAVANGSTLPRPIEFLARRPAVSIGLGSLAWLVVVNPFGIEDSVTTVFSAKPMIGVFGGEFALRNSLYAAAAVLVCIPSFFGSPERSLIRRFLESSPMRFLGTISYGFYLWHVFWIGRAESWLGTQPFNGPAVAMGLITIAFTIPTAAASYYLVERPSLRLVKRADVRS